MIEFKKGDVYLICNEELEVADFSPDEKAVLFYTGTKVRSKRWLTKKYLPAMIQAKLGRAVYKTKMFGLITEREIIKD